MAWFFSQELGSDSLLPCQPQVTIQDDLESAMQQDRLARQFAELRSCWTLLEDHLNQKDTEVQHLSELHQQFSHTVDRMNASLDTIELQLSDVSVFRSDAEETLKSNKVSSFPMRIIAWNCVRTMAFYDSPMHPSHLDRPTSTLILHSFWWVGRHCLFSVVSSHLLELQFTWSALLPLTPLLLQYYNCGIVVKQLT